MSKGQSDRLFRWAFALVVICTLLDRAWMVHTTMGHASDDLVVVWLGATDYARGIFHEPFFYGQDYGVMLEALIAAPFVRLGLDPVPTIAIIFGVFALAPYLAFACYHYRRSEWWPALVFAALPLLLPLEHGLQITALNGIALLAFVPLVWCVRPLLWRSAWLALVFSLAIFVNPNAALVAVPLGTHHLLQYRHDRRTYLGLAIGLLPYLLLWAAVRAFFHAQQAEVVNTIFDWRMHFKPYMIAEAFKRLDVHFEWLAPLSGHAGSLVLVLLIAALFVHIKQRNGHVAWALIATLGLILLSFSFAKVHDGSTSIFFPLSRVFLGMPLVLAWALGKVRISPAALPLVATLLVCTALFHGTWRVTHARQVYTDALQHQEDLPVRTWPVERIKEQCASIASLAQATHADHILLLRGTDRFAAQFSAYGIAVFHPEAPLTWMVGHDRRSFQRHYLTARPAGHVLIMDMDPATMHKLAQAGIEVTYVRASPPAAILATHEDMPIGALLEVLR